MCLYPAVRKLVLLLTVITFSDSAWQQRPEEELAVNLRDTGFLLADADDVQIIHDTTRIQAHEALRFAVECHQCLYLVLASMDAEIPDQVRYQAVSALKVALDEHPVTSYRKRSLRRENTNQSRCDRCDKNM